MSSPAGPLMTGAICVVVGGSTGIGLAAAHARHGRLSVLVNSAGIQRYGTAGTTPVEVWDEVLDVNVRSMFLTAKHAGSIVNVASIQAAASQPDPAGSGN